MSSETPRFQTELLTPHSLPPETTDLGTDLASQFNTLLTAIANLHPSLSLDPTQPLQAEELQLVRQINEQLAIALQQVNQLAQVRQQQRSESQPIPTSRDRPLANASLSLSELQVSAMVDNVPGAIYQCSCDENYTLQFISDQIEAISGYPAVDYINGQQNLAIFPHPDDRNMVDLAVRTALTQHKDFAIEYRIIRADGSVGWVYEKGQGVYSDAGAPLFTNGAIFDVTDRKQTELALQQAKDELEKRVQERTAELQAAVQFLEQEICDRKQVEYALSQREATYHALLSAIPDLMQRTTKDGVYLDFMVGHNFVPYNAEVDWRGKTLYDMLPRELAELRMYYIQLALETGEMQIYEQEIVMRDSIQIEEVRIVVSGEDEVLIIVRDISERKRSEIERKRAEQELQTANAEMRALFAAMTDLIFVTDSQGRGLRPPAGNLELLYIPESQWTNNPIYTVYPQDVADTFLMSIQQCLTTRKTVHAEYSLELNGRETWFDASISPIDGEKVIWVVRDITERKQAEAALRESEAKFRFISERAPIPIVISRISDGVILYANQQLAETYGTSLDNIIGSQTTSFYLEPIGRALMSNLIQNGYLHGYETCLNRADGEPLWVTLSTQPVVFNEEDVFLTVMYDITDRKHAEEALRQSEAQLRQQAQDLEQALKELQQTQIQLIQSEKMSSLGQLVAGIAHEINNPVSFIFGNLKHAREYTHDLLNLLSLYQRHYPDPVAEIHVQSEAMDVNFLMEDLPKLLASMKVGADRIRQIVASFRNFSRMDEADFQQANIHDGIDSTLMILQNRLKAKPDYPAIAVNKSYGELPLVECYPGQLNQVFMNILVNAIDALEDAKERYQNPATDSTTVPQCLIPTISIATEQSGENEITIRIADNGLGMPELVAQHIFDPFFTTKPIGKGTGLGMSISYQIVTDKHNGSLQCRSTLKQGTEFIITIPIQQSSTAL
jgi:two-component system, NtrC family, sensor kinase